jgi:F0F1-type ATP synthase assembly protein I
VKHKSVYSAFALITEIGITLFLNIAFFMWLGHILDDIFKTTFIFTLILAVFGALGGLYIIYKKIV